MPNILSAQLLRGRLEVQVDESLMPPESLFGFAERRNPKRAFLFVSKVLGRHIPARPSVVAACFNQLASQIPSDLPTPILIIGMAETAVGLGAGVHRAYQARRPEAANKILYLVSSRHPLGSALFARFEEEHSHASSHLLHLPLDPPLREAMLQARSLILVDDEASTGKTFCNLYQALTRTGLAKVEQVLTCVLTDWSGGNLGQSMGVAVSQLSLLKGSYCFKKNQAAPLPIIPEAGSLAQSAWPLLGQQDWGRLGTLGAADSLATELQVRPGEKIIVIGSGEFVWRPFLLAQRLERAGAEVHFSATTRSPIALGHSIAYILSFPDNYGLGIPNFLYNVKPRHYDRVLLCVETPLASVPCALVDSLDAEVIVDA